MDSAQSQLIFDPSIQFGLRLVKLPSALHFHGLETTTTKKNLFKDAASLAREFGERGSTIETGRLTDAYCAVTFQPNEAGEIRYFLGRQTNKNAEQSGLVHLVLEPGLYANLKVRSRPGWYLPYRLAKVRQGFHQKYLPGSPYKQSELIDEIEYYNAESRLKYFEKPAMYLLYPLQTK